MGEGAGYGSEFRVEGLGLGGFWVNGIQFFFCLGIKLLCIFFIVHLYVFSEVLALAGIPSARAAVSR